MNQKSLKFKHIGFNTTKMLMPIISNQFFLRYLNYMTDDPLSLQTYDRQGNLVNQPDITDMPIGTSIILTPYDPTVLTDLQVKMFFYPLKGSIVKPISEDTYELDILCPLTYWLLKGSGNFRSFMMAYEIAKMLDSQYEIAGVSKVEITDWRVFKANDTYAGLSLWVNVSNGTRSV